MKRLFFLFFVFLADFVSANQYVILKKTEKVDVNIDNEYIKSITSYVNDVPFETIKLPVILFIYSIIVSISFL